MRVGRTRHARTAAGRVVDSVMVLLVRLTVADEWSAEGAATQLREKAGDDAVLRRVRARVSLAMADRPSVVGERALAILDLALSLDPHARRERSRPSSEGSPVVEEAVSS